MKSGQKFCPRCGTPNKVSDSYCIKCGYDFRKSRRKSSPVLIIILVLIAVWIGIRIFLQKPIFPTELFDIIKNMTSAKSG